MNSKECLEKLYDACDKDLLYEQCGLLGAYKLFEVIKQDLDRLEKLEKVIEKIKKLPNCDECDSNWHKGCMCLQRKIKEVLQDE